MKRLAIIIALLGSCTAALAGSFAIFQVSSSITNASAPVGINGQRLNAGGNGPDAQLPLNALNSASFWQLSTTTGGGGATGQEYKLLTDGLANPVSLVTAVDETALTGSTRANLYVYGDQSSPDFYPAGPWTLRWDGVGAFAFTQDIGGTCSVSPCALSAFTPSGLGMEVDLTSTGVSTTSATFSGTSLSWTGSNFTAGTPVLCQPASGTLPTQITLNTVYYSVSPLTNSTGLATTVGGSAIAFSGGSGSVTCYANWARNMALVQTSQLTLWNNGERLNPLYKTFYSHFRAWRGMQIQNMYQDGSVIGTATFSGSTVTQSIGAVLYKPA